MDVTVCLKLNTGDHPDFWGFELVAEESLS
jgi:hypothetical protein